MNVEPSPTNPFMMDPYAIADQRNIVRRYQVTLDFIGDKQMGRVLDIGERNPFTKRLEGAHGVSIENTSGDLDTIELSGSFDTVLCLEVIEHLMNPLQLLLQIHKVLNHDGSIFLSTPKHKPHFLWGRHHFTEMDEYRLKALVNRAGFQVVRKQLFRTMPFWWYLTGVRPFLRMFHNKVFLLELKKIDC